MESGEGIESDFSFCPPAQSHPCVKSGEGIERQEISQASCRPIHNVESGEGIESEGQPRDIVDRAADPWNPVKELKGSRRIGSVLASVTMWNPVKELKGAGI